MSAPFELESTLTDRYQTTVPQTVRYALKLNKRDKIHYTIQPNGAVFMTRAALDEEDDPALGQFLGFLARDMTAHPQKMQAMDTALMQRIQSLVGELEVDLDAPLPTDGE